MNQSSSSGIGYRPLPVKEVTPPEVSSVLYATCECVYKWIIVHLPVDAGVFDWLLPTHCPSCHSGGKIMIST